MGDLSYALITRYLLHPQKGATAPSLAHGLQMHIRLA